MDVKPRAAVCFWCGALLAGSVHLARWCGADHPDFTCGRLPGGTFPYPVSQPTVLGGAATATFMDPQLANWSSGSS